jgi:hypothetical protein
MTTPTAQQKDRPSGPMTPSSEGRRYRRGYEVGVPIALAVIAVLIVVLILVIVFVLLGQYPGG